MLMFDEAASSVCGISGRKPVVVGFKAAFAGFIEFAPSRGCRSGSRWLHETRFNGCRVQLYIAN